MNTNQKMSIQLVLAGAFLALSGPVQSADDGYRTIYRHLPLADASDAKDLFAEQYGIPVKLAENGTSLRVPKAQAHRAQAILVRLIQTDRFLTFRGGYLIFPQPTEAEIAAQRRRSTVKLPSGGY